MNKTEIARQLAKQTAGQEQSTERTAQQQEQTMETEMLNMFQATRMVLKVTTQMEIRIGKIEATQRRQLMMLTCLILIMVAILVMLIISIFR